MEREGSTPCAQSPFLTLNPLNPAQMLPYHFFKVHFNILSYTCSSSKWPLSFRFRTKLSKVFLFTPMRAPRSAYVILRDINFVTFLSNFLYKRSWKKAVRKHRNAQKQGCWQVMSCICTSYPHGMTSSLYTLTRSQECQLIPLLWSRVAILVLISMGLRSSSVHFCECSSGFPAPAVSYTHPQWCQFVLVYLTGLISPSMSPAL